MGEKSLQIGSKVMVSSLQGAEYIPLIDQISWITGHDKQSYDHIHRGHSGREAQL